MSQDIVLFDGDCAYCNGWVRWITKRDVQKRFQFIALGSPEGSSLRTRFEVPGNIDSIVLVQNGQAHTKSSAAWRVLATLPGWGWVSFLLRLVPRPLRNWGYDLIAKNRHRMGGADTCELP